MRSRSSFRVHVCGVAMTTEPKSRTLKRKKRSRRQREELIEYIAVIKDWDWGYSFSLNHERQPIDPYHDFRHLHIRGRLLYPTGLKTDQIELTLLPSEELNVEKRKPNRPLGVGSLHGYGDAIVGLISVPADALSPILQMMIGERFKFVIMHGTHFIRRRSSLRGFRLEMKIDQDDLPEGVELPT
jgi:hypothetical protein